MFFPAVYETDPATLIFGKRLANGFANNADIAADAIFSTMRTKGISFDALWFLALGTTLTDKSINLIGPNYPITWTGNPALDIGGVSLNGTSQFGNTGLNLATYGGGYKLNDCCLLCFLINTYPGNTFEFGSRATPGPHLAMIRALNSGSKPGFYANNDNQQQITDKVPAGPSFLAYSRLPADTTVFTGFVNGTPYPIYTKADAVPNAPVMVGLAGTTYSPDGPYALLGVSQGQTNDALFSLFSASTSGLISIGSLTTGLGTGDILPADSDPIVPLDQSLIDHTNPPGLIIQRSLPPPDSDAVTNGAMFPGNQFMLSLGNFDPKSYTASTWDKSTVGLTVWWIGDENRRNTKANPSAPRLYVNNIECRTIFSSLATRTALFTAIMMIQMGLAKRNEPKHPQGMGYLDVVAAAGLTVDDTLATGAVIDYAHASANPGAFFSRLFQSFYVMEDRIVVPPMRLSDLPNNGFPKLLQIDAEANDGPTSAMNKALFADTLAPMIHAVGWLGSYFPDPFGQGNASGFSDTAAQSDLLAIYNAMDYTMPMLRPHQPKSMYDQLVYQMGIINPPSKSKFLPYVGFGGSGASRVSDDDAKGVNQAIKDFGLPGFAVFNNGAKDDSAGMGRALKLMAGIPIQ